jgi:hypothetical protein
VGAAAIHGLTEQMRILAEGLVATQSAVAEAKAFTTVLQNQLKRKSSNFDFSHRGNRVQHEFNIEVIGTLTEACTALVEDQSDNAVQFVKQGISKLMYRNKLIKLADKSPAGWATIDEYTDHDLAEDEEDEKKIRRAESAALAKRRKRFTPVDTRSGNAYVNYQPGQFAHQSNRGLQAYRSAYQQGPRAFPQQMQMSGDYLQWQFPQVNPGLYSAPQQFQQFHPPGQARPPTQPRQLGPCYLCGGPHLRNGCPILRSQQFAAQGHITGNNGKN